jgi:RNA polymerase sigma-70 factor (ECF subfamily)
MPSPSSADLTALDSESRAWLECLRADGPAREDGIVRLHKLLLRAARFEAARRRSSLPHLGAGEIEDLVTQSADDALLAALSKLDDFRGNSRFTTWAYKFAVLETAVKLRLRPWQEREIPVEPAEWVEFHTADRWPELAAEQGELLRAVTSAIRSELTPHQREVLVAVAVGGVPIDVLAERLATTRGALYKTIHDARQKLRRRLAADGHQLEPTAEGVAR